MSKVSSKILGELVDIVREKLETSPDEEIAVIITLNPGIATESAKNKFSKMGLKIENVIPGPAPVITGTIMVKDIEELAKASEIEKIEYDGTVYALDK